MNNITIEIKGNNTTITEDVSICTDNNSVCNESLQHQESSVSVTINYNPEVIALFAKTNQVNAVLKNNNDIIFTGIINTELNWTDEGTPYPIQNISFTVNDNTYLFDTETTTEIGLINANLSTIVQKLCDDCNVTVFSHDTSATNLTVEAFVIDKEKNYKTILNNILYQYGFSYYFNAQGHLVYFNFKNIEKDLTPLTENEMITKVKVQKLSKNYGAIKLSFDSLVKKENELVYFKGSGYESDNERKPAVLQKDLYYPFESSPSIEADEGIVEQSFINGFAESTSKYNGETELRRSNDTKLLYTENHTLVNDWDGGNIVVNRTNYSFTKAQVRLQNTGTEDANIYSLSIRADAWYRDTENTVKVGIDKKAFDCQCEYIFNNTNATNTANALYQYFCGGKFKVTAQAEYYYAPGTFVNIDTGISGFTSKGLVLTTSKDYLTNLYTLIIITLNEASIDITRFKKNNSNLLDGSLSENANTNQAIKDLENGTSNVTEIGNPDKPVIISAIAHEESIAIKCNPIGIGLKNTIKEIFWYIKKGNAEWTMVTSSTDISAIYTFDRKTDGYPEASELTNWSVRAKAVNLYGKESEFSDSIAVNTTDYGTWLIETQPIVTDQTFDRTLLVTLGLPPRSDTKKVYGNIQYQVEIKRNDIDTEYFKPATSLNPYPTETETNELNYKDGEGYVISQATYAQVVPLKNQGQASTSSTGLENTVYTLRIKAFNEFSGSPYVEKQLTALCTNIRDLVEAKADYKNLFVKYLSAISANVGTINEGAFGSDDNRWDLSSFVDEHGITRTKGTFKVGNDTGYLRCIPIIENGVIVKYEVSFKASKMEVDADKTSFEDNLEVYDAQTQEKIRIEPTQIKFMDGDTVKTTAATYSANGKATNSDGGEVVNDDLISKDTTWSSKETEFKLREFGYGGDIKTTDDWNKAIGSGWWQAVGDNAPNAPTPNSFFQGFVIGQGEVKVGSFCTQIAFSFANVLPIFYQRTYNGNSRQWGSWKLLGGGIDDTSLDSTTTVLSASKIRDMNTYSDDEVVSGVTASGGKVYRRRILFNKASLTTGHFAKVVCSGKGISSIIKFSVLGMKDVSSQYAEMYQTTDVTFYSSFIQRNYYAPEGVIVYWTIEISDIGLAQLDSGTVIIEYLK